MDFLHYALIQTIKGDKKGRGRSTCFADDEIFFLCEGYWLPSVTTIENLSKYARSAMFLSSQGIGMVAKEHCSDQKQADLCGARRQLFGRKNCRSNWRTAPSILPQHGLMTEPSCNSRMRGLANICVHR
jgi:hypothetical protein